MKGIRVRFGKLDLGLHIWNSVGEISYGYLSRYVKKFPKYFSWMAQIVWFVEFSKTKLTVNETDVLS